MKKFISRTLILSALLVAVFATTVSANVTEIEIGTALVSVQSNNLVMKSEPSATSSQVCLIPNGSVVPVFSIEGYWYKVSYGGLTGYVYFTAIVYTPHDFVISYSGFSGEPFDCETGGTKVYSCQSCSYVFSEEVSAGDHQLNYFIGISTDCEDDVENVTYCSICDWEEIEIVPASGHDLHVGYIGYSPGSSFDCESGGFKVSRCLRELCTYEKRELISPGHDYQQVSLIEPTYHSSGTQTMQCLYCGHRDYITIPALVDDGMSDDFFFAGQNIHDWHLEIVWDLRPRFQLHFWRYANWYDSGWFVSLDSAYAFRLWWS